ncbi:hypothetical protein [Acetobacter aceti]|uniref:hypothetical protein n=1 Tax=Acetobacter aceti TaxID=435 RepID=UPI0011EA580A|nr:hypothetical protein [Acetobacter aceti]
MIRQSVNSIFAVSAFIVPGIAFVSGYLIAGCFLIFQAFFCYYYAKRNHQNINIRNRILKVMDDKNSFFVIVFSVLDVTFRVFFMRQNNLLSFSCDIFEISLIGVLCFAIVDGKTTKRVQRSFE